MANLIENKKKSRKVLRASFTKLANELDGLLAVSTSPVNEVQATFEVLNVKYDSLQSLDSEIYELLLSDATELELESEMDSCDAYVKRFAVLRIASNKCMERSVAEDSGSVNGSQASTHISSSISHTGMRKFKLPRIEFKHYDGSIKDWLIFWAQFKKIHEDSSIDNGDKIEYLRQATVAGSRARQLVESYPAMGENYAKMIESMQSRFGREDLQIEVYVRGLLKLILNNTNSQNKDLAVLYDCLETQLRSLETLGITSDKYAAMLFPLIESCLPGELLRVWQRSAHFTNLETGDDDETTTPLEIRLKKLMLFLNQEVENEQRVTLATEGFGLNESMSSLKLNSSRPFKNKSVSKESSKELPTAAGLVNAEASRCVFCEGTHDSDSCFKAQKMGFTQKKEVLFKKSACYRCLKKGHSAKRCRGRLRCVLCGRSHAILMCPELPGNKSEQKSATEKKEDPDEAQTLANQTSNHVFLQTLRVILKGSSRSLAVRALIDTGSQRSYILKDCAIKLGFPPKRQEQIIHCLFGGGNMTHRHNCYDVTMFDTDFSFTFEALDQPKICGEVAPIFQGPWIDEARVLGIELSDNRQEGPIELLLGADVIGRLYTGERRELPCGLIAMRTLAGWTLMGKMPSSEPRSTVVTTALTLLVNNASISQLWELEALGIKEPLDRKSKEDMGLASKEFFLQTVKVNSEGRYEVNLPWLEDHAPLPTNYQIAESRLKNTRHKLKNDHLLNQYQQIFREWELEGIIEQIEGEEVTGGHYLPHRPVVKKESVTTKIRPVFDASAHEKGKPSLNHCLEKGPNLIELIPSMLLRFRENKIGVVSDIKKAFLQISIDERDRNFVKFLWIDEEEQEIIFQHKRVVFGLICSPFLLAATLEYHLDRQMEKCNSNKAVCSKDTLERMKTSFYVDNCVTSLPTDELVHSFIKEATSVMAEGQFELRGWERTQTDQSRSTSDNPCPVLGLIWCPAKDVLKLNGKFLENLEPWDSIIVTKRLVLSFAQKVFDPIGYLCPSTLVPKMIIQSLWKQNLTWDQPVDETNATLFRNWAKELDYLAQVEIPRWIGVGDQEYQDVSVHVFCDASQLSYACVIFLRVVFKDQVSVSLLAAKARVTPISKTSSKITIPRLELLAATIGARLYQQVAENISCTFSSFFWSDSSTVIAWIQRVEEWGVFIRNRVEEIRTLTPRENWRYLPGVLNPADLPSRGCSPKQLFKSKWWEGPLWLRDPPELWPSMNIECNEEEIVSEKRKTIVKTLINIPDPEVWNLNYFSKFIKTVRMIAWVFRFVRNSKNGKHSRYKGELSGNEVEEAEVFIFKLIQKEDFSGPDDPRIRCLSPFYDEKCLIRLKSRVSNRPDTESYRYPIVLASRHLLVKKLIMDAHVESCHVGTQGLLSLLREKFWILGGRRAIRSVISKCILCKKVKSNPLSSTSPPLPLDRVRDAICFEVTGVDMAGPLYLKDNSKVWICLFTCAVYRAVHLELVTSLSSTCFLQALRRFVSRRGRPKTIYSDNGTNFVGTENALSALDWPAITRETSIQRIQWKFNPPTAAWWGGFWERLIGILKGLLRRSLGRATLTFEELSTLLCECEAVINARPLTYLSEDPKDLVALTPAMFLREQQEPGLPDCDAIDRSSLCLKVRKIQQIRESLRNRFRSEYLGQLKLLCGRKREQKISIGDLVLVGNDVTKRIEWPLARVVELLPGKDGHVRLVRVVTSNGHFMLRPVQRLYPLECSASEINPEEDATLTTEGPKEQRGLLVGRPSQPVSDSRCELLGDDNNKIDKVESARKEITTRSGRVSRHPVRF